MPDEIAIDSGGSSMVRDMKTVPTDMPLLRSIQVLERYFMLQCIHVYPRALFSLAGTSRPCMTYKSNPFSVIQAGRALTVRLWSDWCFAGNVEVCTLTSHINVSGHISQQIQDTAH